MRWRLNGLIAVLSILLLSGFRPLNNGRAAKDAAKEVCGKLIGKKLAPDLLWVGDGVPFRSWHLWAVKPADIPMLRNGLFQHWYFRATISAPGAGPNVCVRNAAMPASSLEAPEPPPPPLAHKRHA